MTTALRIFLHSVPFLVLLTLCGVLELSFGRWFGVWGAVGGWLLLFPAAPFIHLAIHQWRRVVWRLVGGEPWLQYPDKQKPPTQPPK